MTYKYLPCPDITALTGEIPDVGDLPKGTSNEELFEKAVSARIAVGECNERMRIIRDTLNVRKGE